jgi:hypothetical protein
MKANIAYWRSCLREAERELEAAATRAAMNAAASKVILARIKLKQLRTSPRTVAPLSHSLASGRQPLAATQSESDRHACVSNTVMVVLAGTSAKRALKSALNLSSSRSTQAISSSETFFDPTIVNAWQGPEVVLVVELHLAVAYQRAIAATKSTSPTVAWSTPS